MRQRRIGEPCATSFAKTLPNALAILILNEKEKGQQQRTLTSDRREMAPKLFPENNIGEGRYRTPVTCFLLLSS